MTSLMPFVNAIIVAVGLTIITQIAMMVTKCDPIKLLVVCLFLGGILAPIGIWGMLEGFGVGGFVTTVFGAGNACFGAAFAAVKGVWQVGLIIAFLFWLVVTVSCLIGEVKFRQGKR